MDTSDKILVTGAAGFMGSHIISELIRSGYSQVYGVDDLSGGYIENISNHIKTGEMEFNQIDLAKKDKTEDLMSNVRPDIIFHLAANAREGASFFQPLNIVERNYLAYINIIEPAIKYNLDKLVLFSSMAVYGDQNSPFSEDMKRTPVDVYGINKTAMEHTTELLSNIHDFRYTIIRPHNVFGERQSLKDPYRNVIGIFMNRIMRKEPLYIYGDGEQKRSFSYIADSLRCYVKCIEDKVDKEIINIGGMYPITINKLTEMVCKSMNVTYGIYPTEHLSDRPYEVKNAYCTWEKSQKLLGYDEKIGLEKGICKMADWARKKGPQEWSEEELILWNKKAPSIWKRELQLCKRK